MQELMSHIYRNLVRLMPLVLIIVFIIGAIGPSPVRANPGWYHTDWHYRKKITIDSGSVTANLNEFPVLISITSDAGLGTHAEQLNGDDILFTQGNEVTQIPHEIESFSSNGVTANLTAWVKVPAVSSSLPNTEIYMYYGNDSAGNQEDTANVWDSDFAMVQHLQETTGGDKSIIDSTANSNNGTATNNPTLGASGIMDGATTFSTGNDYIVVNDSASLDISGNLTLEAWIYPTTLDNVHRRIIVKPYSSWGDPWYMYSLWVYKAPADPNNNLGFGTSAGTPGSRSYSVNGTLTTDTWQHVAGTYNGTAQHWYINGDLVATYDVTMTIGTSNVSLSIGSVEPLQSGLEFGGIIDEVRISSTARSIDWLKTSYNNQNNPSAFITLGSEEGLAPTVSTIAATSVDEDQATLNGSITDIGSANATTRGFEWATATGPPYSTNWTESSSYGTGAFSYVLSGLTEGELYFYRAMALNPVGWGYGNEQQFLTNPAGPSGLSSDSHGSTWVHLTWSNGAGADSTIVRYQIDSPPGSWTEGSPGYSGTGTSANITGLSADEDYYFRAWSYATEGGLEKWSITYSSVMVTTDSGEAGPMAVGGKVLTVNKAAVLAPWVIFAAVLLFIIIRLIQHFRRKTPSRPPPDKTG